jgi:hypothetical protein
MKKKIILFLALITLIISLSAQEVSLFDSNGEAVAYIDFGEDATIFTWAGTPVAFLEKDSQDICVFGFNGDFLGWYEGGVIYDKKGYVVGARESSINTFTKLEKIKGLQELTPLRPLTPLTPLQPLWKNTWSNTSLTEFLYFGKE